MYTWSTFLVSNGNKSRKILLMYCEARYHILLVIYLETAQVNDQGIIVQVVKTSRALSQTCC